jgi:hypothetical protein
MTPVIFEINRNKMLYIGYPINIETAYSLFKQPESVNIFKHIKELGIHLYDIDKNLLILGYAVTELSNYMSVDETLILILQYKRRLIDALANIDLSDFEIEHMESEPERVHFPAPYIMTYGGFNPSNV